MVTVPAPSTPSLSGMPQLLGDDAVEPRMWTGAGFSIAEAGAVASCAEWATTVPLRRVRKRKREEAICPMVGPSMADRSLFFTALPLRDREPSCDTLDRVLEEAADRFQSGIQASDEILRCLVLVLPGVRGGRLLEATDPSRSIKDRLLRRGIIVGEFFPSCPFATTFNRRLFALRSPAPMYVLRTFIETDWRFVCQVAEWRQTYRERFGEPPKRFRHIGGRWWRLGQKFLWRWDSLCNALGRGETALEPACERESKPDR